MQGINTRIIVTVFILTLFLLACSKPEQFDPNTEYVNISFSDRAPKTFRKIDSTESSLRSFVGDFATPGKAHFHLETDNNWLVDQYTFRFELHSMTFSVGEHRNTVKAKLVDRVRSRTYETELRFPALRNRITITEFGEVGDWIRGSFEIDLCLSDAIQSGSCETYENVISLFGQFNVKRELDTLAKTQGTIQQPYSLGTAPLLRNESVWFSLNNASSFYSIAIDAAKNYRVELRPKDKGIELQVFSDASFSNLICDISKSNDNLFCDISANSYNYLYIKASPTIDVTDPRYFQLEVFDIGKFSSEGTALQPVLIGETDHEEIVFHGQVGNSPTFVPSNEIAKRYGNSFYTVKVQSGHNYGFSLSNVSQRSISLYVFNSAYQMLCAVAAETVCPVYTAENKLVIVTNNDDYQRNGGEYDIEIKAHEGEYFERQGWPDQPRILLIDYDYRGATGYGESNSSYYSVDAPNNVTFTFHVDKLTSSNYQFVVFDDKNFSKRLCKIEYPNTRCAAKSVDNDNGLYVKATSTAPGGMRFTLHPFLGGTAYRNEGSVEEPLAIGDAADGILHDERRQVGLQQSYYRVKIAPNTPYIVSAIGDLTGTEFEIYGANNSAAKACRLRFFSARQKRCTTQSGNGEIDIRVSGENSVQGSVYQLHIEPGGVVRSDEGTIYTPVQLGNDTNIIRASQVGTGGSYFQITSTTGQSRRIRLTDIDGGNINLRVYTIDTEVCTSDTPGLLDEDCILPPPTKATNYVIEVDPRFSSEGANFQLKVEPLT